MFPDLNHVCLCAVIRLIFWFLAPAAKRCINEDLPEPFAPTMNRVSPFFTVNCIGSSDILGISQFIFSIKNSFLFSYLAAITLHPP